MPTAEYTEDDREFAIRAAEYLRQQGLTEDEVQGALVNELGLQSPQAEELVSLSVAA